MKAITLEKPGRQAALLLVFVACCVQSLCGRDAFVLISGGDSPFENNYSQYLQARAVAAWFERNCPPDSVWVFFGAGNIEGEPPVFGDVRRKVQRDGLTLDSWMAGPLRRNRAAKREMILRAFREEILPAVAGGGTLYLFVGDHGERTRGDRGESRINLWTLERDPRNERGWRSNDQETLGVAELRRTLVGGLGKGRVVFCMTQCHAGGFHYLAVPRTMTPNPGWFTAVPDWAASKEPSVFARAAGFTACDEFSPAAGCDPAPTTDEWAGYERFIPEKLFGLDLFTLDRAGEGLPSFAEAHVAATLVDRTLDNPYSTSEQYLERWASLIETRLAKELDLTAKVKKCVAVYERAVDGATPTASDKAFRERQALFRRFTEKLIEQNPDVKDLLLAGTRKELEDAIDPERAQEDRGQQRQPTAQQQRPGRRRGGASPEMRKLWNETVRPAWSKAVDANQVAKFVGSALDFEKYLLAQEAEGRDYFFARRGSLQEEIFWRSGYSDPKTVDVAKAEAVVRWGIERRSRILEWAKAEEDEAVQSAAEKLSQMRAPRRSNSATTNRTPVSLEPVSKETAAERTLFYRRVLAAWEFLLMVNERPALTRLRELTELERTPLPRSGS
ncbi:MAG TPA: hypothetical protein VJW76_13220 [Verrucomicrobiae bacterium]|nr:hypothetical protein [Verrucomicrobiae bacterium]